MADIRTNYRAIMMNAKTASRPFPDVDSIGIGMSALCGVHCLVWPIALGALPLLGVDLAGHAHGGHGHGAFEWTMIGLIAGLAAFAAYRGWTSHRRLGPSLLMAAGLMIFFAVRPELHDRGWIEHGSTVFGGALLVAGHWLNSRLTRARCACSVCA